LQEVDDNIDLIVVADRVLRQGWRSNSVAVAMVFHDPSEHNRLIEDLVRQVEAKWDVEPSPQVGARVRKARQARGVGPPFPVKKQDGPPRS